MNMSAVSAGLNLSNLDGIVALVSDDMKVVEARLAERMESPIGSIPQVGAHLLGAGGKRLRPLLAVLAARAAGAPLDHAVAVGCAAELIHTATLYHDDVVDDGRVRRGRPAARMVFGNGVVVLVGDFCLARALETVALTGSLAMVQSLATTVTEMAEGEVAQLERAGNPDATVEDYFRVIDRKTASLIAWCARVGGSVDTVDAALSAPLERYGRALGRAFQIADDVLDSAIDETTAGKSVGHDLQEGKLTLPVLLACEADPALGRRIRKQLGEQGVPAALAAEILAEVRGAGGVEKARRKAVALGEDAARALGALPPSPYRDALRALAHLSADRSS
ncbi:MAG TPA: polyprenyl synthetase family protein [Polyangia bacterium]|jgi:octaprenyl-diphosphate synthase|nr:polyprenyl synthetase family protein [Polyangia bacterium]